MQNLHARAKDLAVLIGVVSVLLQYGVLGWIVLGFSIIFFGSNAIWTWYKRRRQRNRIMEILRRALRIHVIRSRTRG